MIIELLQQDGFQTRPKGPRECSSPCPACGGNDRLIIKPVAGRYWCRQCNIKGDAIQYLRSFRSMTYRQAAELVGKTILPLPGKRNSHRAQATPNKSAREAFTPPPEQWAANAEALTREMSTGLLDDPVKLAWLLDKRGITRQTAEQFRLGWIHRNIYGSMAAWGLPEQLRTNGKAKKLLIPSGLMIPGPDRLRIRRDEPGDYGKYYVVPGSGPAPLIINSDRPHDITVGIIVESELDAILLCQELKTRCMIVAAGSTSNGPSDELIADLRRRPFVLISLDNDPAGGKASYEKWLAPLRNAVRAPIPPSWGKDHSDAHQAGHDLNLWFRAACGLAPSPHPAGLVRTESAPQVPEPELIDCDGIDDVVIPPSKGESLGSTVEWCQGPGCDSYCRMDMNGLKVEGCEIETPTGWRYSRLDRMNCCPRGKE